jgi:hypothetical protein
MGIFQQLTITEGFISRQVRKAHPTQEVGVVFLQTLINTLFGVLQWSL